MLTRPRSLDEWQDFFKAMFDATNRRVDRSPEDFLGRMSEILGYVTSRKHQQAGFGEYRDYRRLYGKFVAWSCGFLTAQQARFSEVMVQKFPGVCPYCLQTDCVLNADPLASHNEIDYTALAAKATLEVRRSSGNLDLDGWRTKLFSIYTRNYHRDLHVFVDKVHEEQSELTYAFRKLKNARTPADKAQWCTRVKHEFADVFAWFLGLGYQVFYRTQPWQTRIQQTLDEIAFGPYSRGCPDCQHTVCGCPDPDGSLRQSLASGEVLADRPPVVELPFAKSGTQILIIGSNVNVDLAVAVSTSADTFLEAVTAEPSVSKDDIEEMRAMLNQIVAGLAEGSLSGERFAATCTWFKEKGGQVESRFRDFLRTVQAGLVTSGLWEVAKRVFEGLTQ